MTSLKLTRVLLTLAFALWLLAVPAAGHSQLAKSQPEAGTHLDQAPAQTIAWFTEELDTHTSTLQVFDAAQRQVDAGDGHVDLNDPDHATMAASLADTLPAGVYTVHWAAVSAEDGDATEGEFTFTVGDAQAAASTAPAAAGSNAGRPLLWLMIGVAVLLVVTTAVSWRKLSGRAQ